MCVWVGVGMCVCGYVCGGVCVCGGMCVWGYVCMGGCGYVCACVLILTKNRFCQYSNHDIHTKNLLSNVSNKPRKLLGTPCITVQIMH